MMPTIEEIEAMRDKLQYTEDVDQLDELVYETHCMLNQIAQSFRDAKPVGWINAIGGFTFYVGKTETFPESWRALYDIPMPTDDQPTNPSEVSSKLVGDERDAERYMWVPHLSHDEHGRAVCEWWNGSRKLTIYFRDEPPTYVKVWGPHITNEMEDGDILDNECMKALFIWLAAAPDGESEKL